MTTTFLSRSRTRSILFTKNREMTLIYNLSIRVYTFLIRIVAPFNEKARLWIRGRKGLLDQMAAKIDGSKPVVWFHSSSLGEFEQGRPVIEAFKAKYPDYAVLLTFFSPSGYEVSVVNMQHSVVRICGLPASRFNQHRRWCECQQQRFRRSAGCGAGRANRAK